MPLRYDVTFDPPSEAVEAIERGLHAHLETTDFQARAFYGKNGYRVFRRLPGKPAGHTWYFMRKDL